MVLRQVLRAINILILIALAAVLGGIWWFLWRPLPQTAGTVSLPVTAKATVDFDVLGVPHIHAPTQADAFLLQGYVTASERLWQMDTLRRAAAGDLSEIAGPAALEMDEDSRRLRMRRIAEAAYTRLSARDRADMAAYARGVNAFIDSHRNRLSFEFAALSYSPRPWSVIDTILIGLYMFRDLSTSWPEHLEQADLRAHGDPQKVAFLFPVRSGNEVQPGSNAWAISGTHTVDGRPLLANDTHLAYSVPGIWYMTALDAPGLQVMGVAIPGAPGIIIGHNRRIAWGETNLHFNVQDLYREKLNDRTGRYEFAGHQEQARLETEVIRVKGRAPTQIRHWVTRHGPILVNQGGEPLALRWTAAEDLPFAMTFTDIDRALNWADFNAAVAGFLGPGQNFVYADIDGNIGYHASGKLPVRHDFTGDVPLDGASGNFEWDGFIPYDQLPHAFNPPSGIIVTANQNPFPKDYPYVVSGNFASPYRSGQIWSLLHSKSKLTAGDSLRIEKDVYSPFEDHFAKQLVGAWDRKQASNGDLRPAVDELRRFNGQMDKDAIAPLILVRADYYVRQAAAESAAPGYGHEYMDPGQSHSPVQLSFAAIDKLLAERPAGWFRDYDQMLLDCLRSAVEELGRNRGRHMAKWRYGDMLQWRLYHPVGSQLPLIAPLFDIGPVPMSGGATTTKQTTARIGPSERFNAVVGDWEKSLLNVVMGQSGHALSKHYKDEWDAYYTGRSFPMQFEKVDVKSTLVVIPSDHATGGSSAP